MAETSDVEKAERIGRRRARVFAAQAILFVSWQGLFLSSPAEAPARAVDGVKLSAWFVWVLVLLLMLVTGGGLLRKRSVRALLNDELTRSNRLQAYVAGFWAATATAVGLYVLNLFDAVSGRDAIHFILSASIASALITFAARERRGVRGL